MTTAQDSFIPSSYRPLPFKVRDDLIVDRISYQGTGYWVIKDPLSLQYHRLEGERYFVLELLDGTRTLQDLKDELVRKFPWLWVTLRDVQFLITDLHRKGLLVTLRQEHGISLIEKARQERNKKVLQSLTNLLSIRLPGWDPDRAFNVLMPLVRWCFNPVFLTVAACFVAASWLSVLVHFDTFRSRLPEFQQFFGGENLVYLWLLMIGIKVVHEFGHGLACKYFGSECHGMGVMLLVFSPTLYCDVTDSWMLRNKWKRIAIAFAGVAAELFLASIAIVVWWRTSHGLINNLALNIVFVTSVSTVLVNANPLMRFDGYYALSDFLEIPNLRAKATKLLQETIYWYCLGIEPRPDPFMPRHGKSWFVVFAVASSVYQWFVLIGITLFLYQVLKPYGLQNLGLFLGVLSIATMLRGMIVNVYRTLTAPKDKPLNKLKIGISAAVLASVLIGAFTVPIPWFMDAPFLVEPRNVHQVYVATPGILQDIRVVSEQHVQAGQLLVQLEDDDLRMRLHELMEEKEQQRLDLILQQSLNNLEAAELAREHLQSVEIQLAEFKEDLENLQIVAPCAGTVLRPDRRDAGEQDSNAVKLPPWDGTPIDEKNLGTTLQKGTHLLNIAPEEGVFDAVIYVDQRDRNYISERQSVSLKFEHLPDRVFRAEVTTISDRYSLNVPRSMSNKFKGYLPTVTDKQGQERVSSVIYKVNVELPRDMKTLLAGVRGRARLVLPGRSLASWAWRSFAETLDLEV